MKRSQLTLLFSILILPSLSCSGGVLFFTPDRCTNSQNAADSLAHYNTKKNWIIGGTIAATTALSAVSLYKWIKSASRVRPWDTYTCIMQPYSKEMAILEQGITPENLQKLNVCIAEKFKNNFNLTTESYFKQIGRDIAAISGELYVVKQNFVAQRLISAKRILDAISHNFDAFCFEYYKDELALIEKSNQVSYRDEIEEIINKKTLEINLLPYTRYAYEIANLSTFLLSKCSWITYERAYPKYDDLGTEVLYSWNTNEIIPAYIDAATGYRYYSYFNYEKHYTEAPIGRTWISNKHKQLFETLQKILSLVTSTTAYKSETRDIQRNPALLGKK